MLELRLLGTMSVLRDGAELTLPPSKKTRALLAYLAVSGKRFRRDDLCSLLWHIPDDPRGALRWSLSKLRPLLNDDSGDRVVADRQSVQIDNQAVRIDYLDLVAAATAGSGSSADLTLLAETVAGGSTPFLDGIDFPDLPEFQAWLNTQRQEARAAAEAVLSTARVPTGVSPDGLQNTRAPAASGRNGIERRLSAILSADVADYSRLIGADELEAVNAMRTLRQEMWDPTLTGHGGRIIKSSIDGMIVEFSSVNQAVEAGLSLQKKMQSLNPDTEMLPRIQLRIGVNLGDILIEGDDIFGDGVNIAARLKSVCSAGGLLISGSVFDQLDDTHGQDFVSFGGLDLKNISRPVSVYHWGGGPAPHRPAEATPKPTLADPGKPSIAVLPFANMSGISEEEYFADGMTDGIITALSCMPWVFVISRTSSFTYKNVPIDIRKVAEELGVRYLLEGTVSRSPDKVRVSCQLVDAETARYIWAQRFDRPPTDVFEMQDDIAGQVVAILEPKLRLIELERSQRKPPAELEAYDYYLRSLPHSFGARGTNIPEAIKHLEKSLELDPKFAPAAGLAAWLRTQASEYFTADGMAETKRLANVAVEYGGDDAFVLAMSATVVGYFERSWPAALSLIDRAIKLNPNNLHVWTASGWIRMYYGDSTAALEDFDKAERLSPLDPTSYVVHAGRACALFQLENFEEAAKWARIAAAENPRFTASWRVLAASLVYQGDLEAAQEAADQIMKQASYETIAFITELLPYHRKEMAELFAKALRQLDYPE